MESNNNTCPCGKGDRAELERIHRGFLVKTFLFWLPLKKYKCYKCMRSMYMLEKKATELSNK